MLVMEIDEYIKKMKNLGWSDQHISKLVNIYIKSFQTNDGRIKVLSGDFNKKNLRRFESSFN